MKVQFARSVQYNTVLNLSCIIVFFLATVVAIKTINATNENIGLFLQQKTTISSMDLMVKNIRLNMNILLNKSTGMLDEEVVKKTFSYSYSLLALWSELHDHASKGNNITLRSISEEYEPLMYDLVDHLVKDVALIKQKSFVAAKKNYEETLEKDLNLMSYFVSETLDSNKVRLEKEYKKLGKQALYFETVFYILLACLVVINLFFNRILKRSLQRIFNDLEISRDRAKVALKSKNSFLAGVSHELRTPLHAMINFSEFGIQDMKDGQHDEIIESFETINKSSRRLLGLINDILEFSKMEEGKEVFNFANADLTKVIQNAVVELASLFENKKVTVDFQGKDKERVANIDATKIHQFIVNILSNAAKHVPEGGCVTITVEEIKMTLGRRASDTTLVPGFNINIADTGAGVPDEYLDKIFNRFTQTDEGQKKGGTGLGLAICQKIAHAHLGQLEAKHNEPQGLLISLRLPKERQN